MAIVSALCNSFKRECLLAEHNVTTDVIKIALFTSSATLGKATTAYSATNEVVGAGYTAGGVTLTNVTAALDGDVAVVDFDDVTISSATITARGALIYNSSKANKAIAVYNFGEDKTSSGGDYVLSLPPATSVDAIIRLS